jgi:hypothetical protein
MHSSNAPFALISLFMTSSRCVIRSIHFSGLTILCPLVMTIFITAVFVIVAMIAAWTLWTLLAPMLPG